MVYSTRQSRLFSVTESLNWQNRAGPISPEIEIKPDDAPGMVRVLEAVARKHGYLQPGKVVDFNSGCRWIFRQIYFRTGFASSVFISSGV